MRDRLTQNAAAAAVRYGLTVGLVGLATLLGLPLRPFVRPANLVMLYLLAVVLAAIGGGRRPAIVAALLGVLAFDLMFVPPYYDIVVADAEYLLTLAGLLTVGIVTGTLASRAREQALAARRREAQTAALYGLSQRLATADTADAIAGAAVDHVQATFGSAAALFLAANGGGVPGAADAPPLTRLAASSADAPLDSAQALAVLQTQQPQGGYLPLLTAGRAIGVLALAPLPPAAERPLLEAVASQVALALDKAYLAQRARRALLLEETEKLQTALLNAISHDFRTPLASITGALSSLLTDDALLSAAARQDLLQNAWEQALRLNRQVAHLLDMARLEAGALTVTAQPYDVEELIGATLAQMQDRLHGRTLLRDVPADLPPVSIDLALMIEALINVIDNALKYAPPAAPVEIVARRVRTADPAAPAVQIVVRDRGPGLPPGAEQQIFDKFFRFNPAGSSGTGLGLAVARAFVELNGGRITASNRAGGGAVFMISLPAVERAETRG